MSLDPNETLSGSRPSAFSPALIMACVAIPVLLPAILYGYPTGHDTFIHATAWFDVVQHWREGALLPAWGGRFAMGWGQPIYLFYPPVSLYFGGVCLALFGPYFAPIFFAWTVLTLSGYTAFRLAQLLGLRHNVALLAGVAYLLSPYLGLTLYERNAFAEALAASVFPALLYAYVRMQRDQGSPLYVAFALALVAIINVPTTAIAGTVIVVLALMDAVRSRSVIPVARTAIAVFAAIALSSFYLVPLFAQKSMVRLYLVATGGQDPEKNFALFSASPLFAHDFFSNIALISGIGVLLMIVFFAVAARSSAKLPLWTSWIGLAVFTLLLMLPITGWIYRTVPGMRAVNFPWRYMTVVSLLTAILMAYLVSQSRRGLWALVLTATLYAGAWFAMWPPSYLHDPMASWGKYSAWRTAELPGVRELVPITASFQADGNYGPQERVTEVSVAPCKALKVMMWENEHREVHFDCPQETVLLLKSFFYPGWRVLVDGHPARVGINDRGALLVTVHGLGELDLRFVWTNDRIAGWSISLLALLACAGFVSWKRSRNSCVVAA